VSAPAPRGLRRLLAEGKTFLTALIALVAATVGLLFQLDPSRRPDPRERVGAAVEIFAVERGVRIGDWLKEAFPNDVATAKERVLGTATPEPSELTVEGTVVYVRTEVDGYKHRSVALRARLYRWHSQQRVPTDFAAAYRESSGVTIDSPNRRSVQLLFVSDLRDEPKPEFLRVQLVDSSSGAILAIADSPQLLRGRIRR
jgi:hypothetical protein